MENKVLRENRETIVKEEKSKETEQGLKVEERKAGSSKIRRINSGKGGLSSINGYYGIICNG